MRVTQKTLDLLKVISLVNRYIVLNENSGFIRVINNEMVLFAETTVDEVFPYTTVLDSAKFFGLASFFEREEGIEIDFTPTNIIFKNEDEKKSASIVALDPKMISYFPFVKREIALPPSSKEASFILTKSALKEVKQAASVLGLEHLAIRYDTSGIQVSLEELKKDYYNNPTSDLYSFSLEGETENSGVCYLKLQYLSLLYPKSSYNVSLYSIGGKYKAVFNTTESDLGDLKYYLAGVVQ